MFRSHVLASLFLCSLTALAGPLEQYALVLSDAPAITTMPSRAAIKSSAAVAYRSRIQNAQKTLRGRLEARGFGVSGSVDTLANAIFVTARQDQVAELQAMPGVTAVVRMAKLRPKLNKAIDVVNARTAWTALGGSDKAGAGIKIAVLDTGIDETHPGFRDSSLSTPSGFPKFNSDDDKTHTNSKVIVARSYVDVLTIGNGTAETTTPDDYSVRDRVGHGTAVAMAAAGASHTSPAGVISGIAPKAWVGNYKIFGSPGVNDYTNSGVVMRAIEDAYLDGMDIALLSSGTSPASWSPNDFGGVCGEAPGVPCDPLSAALVNAINGGMTIVVPAGDDGESGLNSIETPGTLTSLITVGASTNVQDLHQTAITATPDFLAIRFTDGPRPSAPLTRPLVDAGLACGTVSASVSGAIALIQRGTCSFATKANFAAAAGAAGILFYREPGGSGLFSPTGLGNSSIPSALTSADGGAFLKTYLAGRPGGTITLDPSTAAVPIPDAEAVASYSSRGPNLTDSGIKPELVAPGNIYTAAQNYDPNGSLYSANRYAGAEGTSFSTALVAGALALVKQAHPNYTAAQLKSAVTNTASTGVIDFDSTGAQIPARVITVGAGKLNVGAAVQSNVTVEPPVVNFGAVIGPLSKTIKITNTGNASATLQLSVSQRDTDAKATVTVSPPTLSLSAGQAAFVTVALTGSAPVSGFYEGVVNVSGGAVPLRIPYLYLVGARALGNILPLFGSNFVVEVGNAVVLVMKLTDPYGLPLAAVPMAYQPPNGGTIYESTSQTDGLGIAAATIFTAKVVGEQAMLAGVPNVGAIEFDGRTRLIPQIKAGGIVDAASFQTPAAGFAPGSYLSIFGTGLSENTMISSTPYLPVSLAGVAVSFDAADSGIHVPGHLYFTSSGQISVQIPWELQSVTSAILKVTISGSSSYFSRADNQNLGTYQSQTVTVPIGQFSPAFFEYSDGGQTVAAATDESGKVVGSSNAVGRGRTVVFYANGLGDVAPGTKPPSGEAASSTVLASTRTLPTVTIGNQQGQVQFSGLAPGYVGLYQINVVVPQGISTGLQPAVINIGGVTSKTTMLQVK